METNGKVCCECGEPACNGDSGWQEPRCELHETVWELVTQTAGEVVPYVVPRASLEALRLALPKCQGSRSKVGAMERRIRKLEKTKG